MKDKIKNAIKEFFKKEETTKEVEERLMKVIRKLYKDLEWANNDIRRLGGNPNACNMG
jgi:hypothetical protein